MHTSFVMVALAALTAADPAQPTWLTDYRAAQKQCATLKKPIAVVLGTGAKGYEKLVREGTLPAEVSKALASNYVCVYLDTSSSEGKQWAEAFEMSSGRGLVISDRTGDLQAFRHEGDLNASDLADYLKRYGDPSYVVQRTDSGSRTSTSYYNGGSSSSTTGSPSSYYPATGASGFNNCPT